MRTLFVKYLKCTSLHARTEKIPRIHLETTVKTELATRMKSEKNYTTRPEISVPNAQIGFGDAA